MTAKALDRFSLQAPAATLFVGLTSRILSDETLDDIFRQHREPPGRIYDIILLFGENAYSSCVG